jgi:hypothetical protein
MRGGAAAGAWPRHGDCNGAPHIPARPSAEDVVLHRSMIGRRANLAWKKEHGVGRFVAVSFKPYRGHQLELRDGGRGNHAVIIHPPGGRGAPHELPADPSRPTLNDMVLHARALIDGVMGPKPVPTLQRGGYRGAPHRG